MTKHKENCSCFNCSLDINAVKVKEKMTGTSTNEIIEKVKSDKIRYEFGRVWLVQTNKIGKELKIEITEGDEIEVYSKKDVYEVLSLQRQENETFFRRCNEIKSRREKELEKALASLQEKIEEFGNKWEVPQETNISGEFEFVQFKETSLFKEISKIFSEVNNPQFVPIKSISESKTGYTSGDRKPEETGADVESSRDKQMHKSKTSGNSNLSSNNEICELREDEFGFCKGCGNIPEKCSCGNTFNDENEEPKEW
jgi:bifunctional DNA-binding transcriptional regulator/antitoxin component of YhaV-PrlF toxin-antitoxin module